MPIKVTCGDCGTTVSAPDAAAGKVMKCKACGGRVKVPAAGAAASGGKPSAARKAPQDTYNPDDPFGGIDTRRVEDTNRKVCPACATPVRVDEVECPKCGVTIATGTLSEKQRIRRERKGPPPEEFYGAIWKNAWKFLKNHWGYGVRTAAIWSTTLSLSMTCLYVLNWYVDSREEELLASAAAEKNNIEIFGNTLIINVPKDGKVRYDNKLYTIEGQVFLDAPRLAAIKSPPTYFWFSMVVIFQLGFGGWGWTLATKIADLTMAGEKKIKRFEVDFFANLTMGFRFYFWPIIVMYPVLVLLPFALLLHPVIGGITAFAIFAIPMLLFLPAAVVHMSQKYTYRAWLIYWMVRDFFKTIGATLYIAVLNIVLVLLVPAILSVVAILMGGRIINQLVSTEQQVLEWLAKNIFDFGEGNMRVLFYEMPLVFTSSFLFFLIVCSFMAFPAVFMMRVIGLYGVYFKPDLSIVNEFPDFEPAGFGPRFLAFQIDSFITFLITAIFGNGFAWLAGLFCVYIGLPWLAIFLVPIVYLISNVFLVSSYYAKGESGATRATLGKWSLGLIVLTDDNKPVTLKQGYGRAFSAFLTTLTFYIGFLMCAFRADRKAMHDLMSKTKVVFRTDENTTR